MTLRKAFMSGLLAISILLLFKGCATTEGNSVTGNTMGIKTGGYMSAGARVSE